jgi:hypothetical protein
MKILIKTGKPAAFGELLLTMIKNGLRPDAEEAR